MQTQKQGFTLIELILVVAVVAILSVIAIGKFSDIRKESARKANVANIKNIFRTINTEIVRVDGDIYKGMFAYAEALIDVDGQKAPSGSPGTYAWMPDAGWYDGAGGTIPGIYCGIKQTAVVENASGATTGSIAALADAHENNVGLDAFAAKLGMYYLTEKEVASLKDVGVSIVSYHNYSNAQSKNLGWNSSVWYTGYGLHSTGGGPGHRPDLSACYPVVLTNGMPVAVLNPAACESIYRDLGLEYASTYNVSGLSSTEPETYFAKGICQRLIVLGLGRDTETNTKFFENQPRCMTLDKTHYRNYLLVFQLNNGQGNQGTTAKFVGVLDPAGNTAKQAQYNADWAS
ncbi:MAG: prepilin-type N-terminal cleavage/methylation domain-containing protein [Kiritimatiellae bacterium]|nr:prepilin-type N-terminal cleavage/methylation domain-containing protein [Clostridia bacterium]MBP5510823.1 prepilin-type N-terminal cleavage/methylation domain-containing protein [Kiritimatiellia bacterium]